MPAGGRIAADAVVVGSGAGGGVAAALLAQAGLRVVVLEAGPASEAVAARQREADAFDRLYLEAGLCATADLGVSVLAGACVGGGTTVNWSTSLRLPSATAESWATAVGRPELAAELAEAYDAVEARLGVTTATAHNRNNAVSRTGARRSAGLAGDPAERGRAPATAAATAAFGCAYGTKQSTAVTYLRDAVDAGAQVFAGVRVDRVRLEAVADDAGGVRRAVGVDAVVVDADVAGGAATRMLTVDAPLVVVAAGALRTPGLLARSGVTSPHLGKHLHLHPTSALSAQFDERVDAWHGVMQSALCDRFSTGDDGDGAANAVVEPGLNAVAEAGFGATIEAAPAHPGLMALAQPWLGRDAHADTMTSAAYRASLISLTRDRGEGTRRAGRTRRHRVHARDSDDARNLAARTRAARRASRLRPARCRCRRCMPSRWQLTSDGRGERRDRCVRARAAPSRGDGARIALFSAHQMGTARMAADAANGVIDGDGRVFGVDGLLSPIRRRFRQRPA